MKKEINKGIFIEGLCKSFGDYVLFDNFNLNIESREFVVIAGESGCGKTTLLNMIGGLETIDNGKVYVNGYDIVNMKDFKNYFRHEVGFIFQNFALVEQKTVKENLEMVHPNGKSGLSVKEALKIIGMEKAIHQKVYTLSGGEQQRISLARLLMKDCNLILADEPTASLDRRNGEIIIDFLKQINKNGKTVIMVTHDENLMEEGNRTIYL
ncbi:ATP-binding cassette domain-containing protein [Anaerosalibacter massiliensis]|uniref:ATP-binding cassette domain-containing protein n=1 Tax=Anaerosalibacter massiliensis TaxID=1347392 RepID=A0A9X2ME87_9FIRM|nr:ATP-binding cassette domain-containing protein [Anaerosalibacter massiliensis]MCR2043372.1 ATP-binding cassette domain-containing protein [Anaerosalibacter massiliensis]